MSRIRGLATLATSVLFVLASEPVLAARYGGYRAPPPRRAPMPSRSAPRPAPMPRPAPKPLPQKSPISVPKPLTGKSAQNSGKQANGNYQQKPDTRHNADGSVNKKQTKAEQSAKAAKTGSNPKSASDAVKLNKSLASQAQMKEPGVIIAGGGKAPFRDAQRVARTHGGKTEDWVKKSSSSYTDKDGNKQETHWVENIKTGKRAEFKTVVNGKQ